jgi:Cu-Zn family superoxide dismutase
MKSAWLGLIGLLVLMPPAVAQDAPTATTTFMDVDGKEVGKATLLQTPAGVLIELEVRGLAPGIHAFHVHEKGICDGADKFNSAGGHYNVGGKQHGFLMTGGPHAGDMPNQFVGSDGILRAHIVNPNVTLGTGAGTLFGPDGTALIIHAKQDDYRSQPAGDAGDRVACAVVKRQ